MCVYFVRAQCKTEIYCSIFKSIFCANTQTSKCYLSFAMVADFPTCNKKIALWEVNDNCPNTLWQWLMSFLRGQMYWRQYCDWQENVISIEILKCKIRTVLSDR